MDKTLDACLSLRMDTCRKLHAFECKSELPTLGRTIATITTSVTIRLQTAPELPSYSSAKKTALSAVRDAASGHSRAVRVGLDVISDRYFCDGAFICLHSSTQLMTMP